MSLQVQNCKFTNQGQKVNILKQSELQRKTIFFSIGLSIFISSPIPYLSRWKYLYWIVHKDFRLRSDIIIGVACTSAISWFPQRHFYLSAIFKLRSRFQSRQKKVTPEKFFSEKYSGPGSTKPWVNIFLMESFLQGNIVLDVLETIAFEKYSISWVFETLCLCHCLYLCVCHCHYQMIANKIFKILEPNDFLEI